MYKEYDLSNWKRLPRWRRKAFIFDVAISMFVAGTLSGIPSTVYAYYSGGDVMESTRAAGAMLVSSQSSDLELFLATCVVHGALTFFWAVILVIYLPKGWEPLVATIIMLLVGVIHLFVFAPIFFPSITALDPLPQFADHAMLGFCFGLTVYYRRNISLRRVI